LGASSAAVAARELLAREIVSLDEAVLQGIVLTERSVSHRSFRVDVGGTPALFVKQADAQRSQGRDLTTEAAVYRLARSSAALAEVVPPVRLVSADDSLIVLDAVAGTSLAELPVDRSDPRTSAILREYGRAVARTHQVRPPPLGQPPWLLGALEPGWGTYEWLPDPTRELLLRLAGTPTMRQAFRRAATAWRAECLIHGDLRSANVLVVGDAGSPSIRLVDWELACLGDPAWDIGSVLADLLATAAFGVFEGGRAAPDTWEAAHAFLGGYRALATAASWPELLQRSVWLAGVRLVQSLVEYGQLGRELLAAQEPVLLPWAAHLLAGAPEIVAELAPP
jgi:hypothetical protein